MYSVHYVGVRFKGVILTVIWPVPENVSAMNGCPLCSMFAMYSFDCITSNNMIFLG